MQKVIYRLENDKSRIKSIQKVSIDEKSRYGFKIENNLIFGTKEWFNAIQIGLITKYIVTGRISKIYSTSHNDFPVFEIENEEGKTQWVCEGNKNAYEVGKYINITYVKQKFKFPLGSIGTYSNCVIEIRIE